MARPKAKINLAEVERLYSMQCTDDEVAAFFGLSVRTIERRRANAKFREATEQGKAKGRISVRRMLFTQAAKGNIAAIIFLAKNVLGYRDALRNEHSVQEGTELQMVIRSVLDPKPEK